MKYLAVLAAGLMLTACEGAPGLPALWTGGGAPAAPSDSPRQQQFVALVEQNGCRVDPQDHAFVHGAGFSDLEIGEFGKALATEGRAEVTADGGLLLMTGRCI